MTIYWEQMLEKEIHWKWNVHSFAKIKMNMIFMEIKFIQQIQQFVEQLSTVEFYLQVEESLE